MTSGEEISKTWKTLDPTLTYLVLLLSITVHSIDDKNETEYYIQKASGVYVTQVVPTTNTGNLPFNKVNKRDL